MPMVNNRRVNADCLVLSDDGFRPTTEVAHYRDEDIASKLRMYVIIYPNVLSELRAEAIAAIDEAVEGVTNAEILAIAQEATDGITNDSHRSAITSIKDAALAELQIPVKYYNSGKTDAFGPLGTPHPGPAVKVTKGDTEVILYLPDKVEYIIRK